MYLLPLLNFNRYVFNPSTTLSTTFPQFPLSNSRTRLSNTSLDFIPPPPSPLPRIRISTLETAFCPEFWKMLNTNLEFPREKRGKREEKKGRTKKKIPSSASGIRGCTHPLYVAPAHGQTNCSRVSIGGEEGEEGGSDKTRRIENHGFDRP